LNQKFPKRRNLSRSWNCFPKLNGCTQIQFAYVAEVNEVDYDAINSEVENLYSKKMMIYHEMRMLFEEERQRRDRMYYLRMKFIEIHEKGRKIMEKFPEIIGFG
jgi:hypothetical protein